MRASEKKAFPLIFEHPLNFFLLSKNSEGQQEPEPECNKRLSRKIIVMDLKYQVSKVGKSSERRTRRRNTEAEEYEATEELDQISCHGELSQVPEKGANWEKPIDGTLIKSSELPKSPDIAALSFKLKCLVMKAPDIEPEKRSGLGPDDNTRHAQNKPAKQKSSYFSYSSRWQK